MKLNNGIEIYGYIYKITNVANGKCYIGQSTQLFNLRYKHKGIGVERVYNHFKRRKDRNVHYNELLLNDMEYFGLDSFELIMYLDVAFSKKELDIKERHYIDINKINKLDFGYNKHGGGSLKNGKFSKYTINKMRNKTLNMWKTNYNYHFETRARGENHGFYNKHHTLDTKKKISNTLNGRYYSSKNPTSIRVICLDDLNIYECIRDIERELNIQNQNISKCCKGKRNSAGKKKFMYLDDYNYCIENSINFDLYKKEKYNK